MLDKQRLLKLYKLSASIFNQNFNPNNVRDGTKFLTKRLKGPTLASYYGNKDFLTFSNLKTLFPLTNFVDPDEEYRLNKVESLKRRGKGAPKKIKKNEIVDKKTKKGKRK